MEKVSEKVYKKIDNELYNAKGDIWWSGNTVLSILKTSVNPWRVGYSSRIMQQLGIDPNGKTALEVGCGGGILTEEIRKMGFVTTGIDPSEESLKTAAGHAAAGGLTIQYDHGTGENLPYADQSFDCVFCCDVLEHVQDLPKVVSEIARVLKHGGT
ncbi:MAG TPA: class I SAM-dependent methyltransferase, partial [Flavisolibacter sp.]